MCVKSCDCNNCLKTKTCTDCEYSQYIENFINVECNSNGVQGCPFKLTLKKSVIKELTDESSNN